MEQLKARPLGSRVIVLPEAAEEITDGGIIIPDTAKERPSKGTVAAIGQGTLKEPMECNVGDRVMYSKYSGTEIELDKTTYLIMRQEEILLVY